MSEDEESPPLLKTGGQTGCRLWSNWLSKDLDLRKIVCGGCCLIAGIIVITQYSMLRWFKGQNELLESKVKRLEAIRTGSLSKWEQETLYEWAKDDLTTLKNLTDFRDFSLKLRKFKLLFQHYESEITPSTKDDSYGEMGILGEMEMRLFPWAQHYYSTLLQMKRSFNGAGIVIPTGSNHFKMAVFLVKTIRKLGCTLPISIAHGGNNDLKPQELFYLYQLRVNHLDVSQYVDVKMLQLKGWQIKPFALLVAPYSEVILMDADVVLMKNPETLLRDPGYLEHHAIFFRDRTLFDKDWKKTLWLDENLPAPLSDSVKETRMYRQVSGHEQESGIVIMNKNERLFSLLAACKMNGQIERDRVIYKEFYGDKETFWIGVEMAGESYTTLWPRAGVIGSTFDLHMARYDKQLEEAKREKKKYPKKPKKKGGPGVVCGRIAHFDRSGEPLWFNGGIVLDKGHDEKKNYLNTFTHYAHEGTWEFAIGCIIDAKPLVLPTNITNVLKEMGQLWRPKINLIDLENYN